MEKLTPKQKKVLEFIISEISLSGMPPTLRRIRDHFGLSSLSSPRHYLRELAEKGYINLVKGASRGIEAVSRGVPLLGEVSAGLPVDSEENIDGYLDMSRAFSGRNVFCLRIRGESMSGAGIIDGDIVIVRKQAHAADGDIVAALVDGEALIKRLRKKNRRYYLCAEHPAYGEIRIESGSAVLGKVVGVFRDYEQVSMH